jgi:hypothetical protein
MKATSRQAKARGELAEMRFLLAAALHGLIVCMPWGDNQPFDFLVGRGERFYRVQVKSCASRRHRAFRVKTSRACGRGRYTAKQIDILVAYIVPENAWYLIPVKELAGRRSISVYPHNPRSRGMYEHCRERWQLLRRR